MKTLSKILAVAILTACAEINPQTASDETQNEIILKENRAHTRAAQALEPGDEIGLFAVKSAQPLQPKNNAINNAKLLVQSDLAIKGEQVIYYPNRTDKVDLFSYFPYQSGDATADALGVLVGIRTTQTDFSSLKFSDLCYGSAKGVTPTNSAQSITYAHAFAQFKLNFSAYNGCPAIKSVKLLNIKDSALLNLATGTLTLRPHLAEVIPQNLSATEFLSIVPAQPLQGACVAVTLTDYTTYIYSITAPLTITAGATNTLSLSIVDKSTIQMDATPAITAWHPIATAASTTQSINNQITLRWLVPHPSFATVDKIILTLVDLLGNTQEVEVSPTLDPASTATYALYTFALQVPSGGGGGGVSAATALSYPLAVTRLCLYAGAKLLRDTPQPAIIASQIARRGAHTLGLHLSIAITPAESWLNVTGYGASRQITVTTIGTSSWTASATGTGLSVTPTSGTSGQAATITWAMNGDVNVAPPSRSGLVTFATLPSGASATITTDQNGVAIPAVRIGNVWWASGNLVANGANGAKIGAPADCGLFFQFGSLIGWTGGANGDGTGTNAWPALAIKIKPSTYSTIPAWTACPKFTEGTNSSTLVPFCNDKGASGIGDPCRFYLGDPWRLPTTEEYKAMHSNPVTWQASPAGHNFNSNSNKLFFPITGGFRDNTNWVLRETGSGWSGSVSTASKGYSLHFNSGVIHSQYPHINRDCGITVRCVFSLAL